VAELLLPEPEPEPDPESESEAELESEPGPEPELELDDLLSSSSSSLSSSLEPLEDPSSLPVGRGVALVLLGKVMVGLERVNVVVGSLLMMAGSTEEADCRIELSFFDEVDVALVELRDLVRLRVEREPLPGAVPESDAEAPTEPTPEAEAPSVALTDLVRDKVGFLILMDVFEDVEVVFAVVEGIGTLRSEISTGGLRAVKPFFACDWTMTR